ncbi:diguanylate cyclase domain-containing protein [Desulfurobacterium thermolithotrophum]|uniref:diguanylate cyclase domain-containing protein n=1 Tax=Desulfurobacterium thermolithotrophum TaxID=64160 RepID=UPI00030740CA|nr:diguanylate cyclase [Desulfurobacterium thermolithotrophum]
MELERDIAKLEVFWEDSAQTPPEWIKKIEDKVSFIELVDSTAILYIRIADLKIFLKIKIPIKEIPDVNIKNLFLLSQIFQKIPIGVLIFKQQVVYANTFIEKIFEKPCVEIINSPAKDFLPEEIIRNIHKLFSKESIEREFVLKWIGSFDLLSGNKRHLLIIATSTFIDEIPFGIALFFDISREKNFLTEMVDLHSYDSVIGLSNLKSALEFIENLRKNGKRFLVGLVDIDNFSLINDSFGIETGDKVLREFVERLRKSFNPNYYQLFRTVSDQFLIISLRETDRTKEIKYIVNKIKKLLEIPFKVNGSEIFLSVNFGFSFYPEHGDSVLTKAEIALKHAREEKLSYAVYSLDLEFSRETIEILSNIKEDIKNDRIEVFFQPKVDLNSGKILGAEALMRSSVPPNKAIPVIIRYGC